MVRFFDYAVVSTLCTFGILYYAYATRLQFYPMVIYLVTSKSCVLVLGNMALVLTLMFGQLVNKLFLGRLREVEKEIIWEKFRFSFTETCLALSTFREELSLNVLALFTSLIFIKVFHWLCEARIEHIEQSQDTSRLSHLRTVSLMAVLLIADCICAKTAFNIVQANGHSVQIFFGFEYVLLGMKVFEVFCKYCLCMVDSHFVQGQWYNKSLYELYLRLIIDVLQLFVNVVFFAIIFVYYGIPLHLTRPLYVAVKNVHNGLTHFFRFRRITSNLHERFPDATAEDLDASDRTCIICREEMEPGAHMGAPKKLPCGHIFHFFCLRNWLERQLKCPTCRSEISTHAPPPQRETEQQANNQGGEEARAQAAPVAPVGGGVPPPHVERQRPPFFLPPGVPNAAQQQFVADARIDYFAAANERAARLAQAQAQAPPAPQPAATTQQVPQSPGLSASQPPPLNPTTGMPDFAFPPMAMGLPPMMAGANGNPMTPGDFPSVTQIIQGQIDILQLQLQVYQAQIAAAEATRRAAAAVMPMRRSQMFTPTKQRPATTEHGDTEARAASKRNEDRLEEEEEEEEEEAFDADDKSEAKPMPIEQTIPTHESDPNSLRNRAREAAIARAQQAIDNNADAP